MRFLAPLLAPTAPLVVAMVIVAGRQAGREHLEPCRRSAPTTRLGSPAAGPPPAIATAGRRFVVTPASRVRFRPGGDDDAVWASASARGDLTFDDAGLPAALHLDVDLASLRRGDQGVFHQIAWDVLGAERTGRLVFHGARQSLTRSVVPGVMTVAFQGSVQLGGAIRHVVIPLRFAMLQPARIRVIGRGRAFCSDYGLTGWRTGLPFGAEQPILLVWDLVLQPFVP